MKKILDYINNLSEGKFISFSILIALICTIPFNFSNIYMGMKFTETMSLGWYFFVAIIIVPIFESILIVIVSYLIGQAIFLFQHIHYIKIIKNLIHFQ